jgi:dihydroorotate dehydrogenase electron transfer subunit
MPIDRNARILNVRNWDDYYLVSVESPEIGGAVRPGQFVMIKVAREPFPLLRRPLSVHDAGARGFELFFKIAGVGTEILASRKPGDTLDVLGPLGRGFTVSERLKGARVALIGGGRGIAPLYFLGRELLAVGARPVVLYGGRCLLDLPLRDKFAEAGLALQCSTDDGTFGYRGLVTELLPPEAGPEPLAFVFACGPDAMMKAAARAAESLGIPCELSLESVMGCGIGACWGCVHRVRNEAGDGWVKICEEGPVFPGDKVVWAE